MSDVKALLERHAVFWRHERSGEPLVRVDDRRERSRLENTDVTPDMIDVEALTPLVGRRDGRSRLKQGDLFRTESAFSGVPWMEAICGCAIHAGAGEAMWGKPALGPDFEGMDRIVPRDDNPWLAKLLALTRALVEACDGTYLVTHTLMRGPIDILSALIGDERMGLAFYDEPERVARVLSNATEAFLCVARAQYAIIPPYEGGWAPWAYSLWAPGTVIRTQTDSSSQISAETYVEQILPHDRAVFGAFDYSIIDLHSAGTLRLHPVLLEVDELDAISVTIDPYDSAPTIEDLIPTFAKILEAKSLSVFGRMSVEHAERLKKALPTGCLSIYALVTG